MISDPELDRVLVAWLAEGSERAPAHDAAAAIREVAHTTQRGGLIARWSWASALSTGPWRVAAALVMVAAVVGVLGSSGGRWTNPMARPGDVPAVGGGVMFGPATRIAEKWFSDDATAFTAVLPPGAGRDAYWRAVTYNEFMLSGWQQTAGRDIPVAAGAPLMAGTAEAPDERLTTPVTITVQPGAFNGNELLTPGTATSVDRPSTVRVAGDDGWFSAIDLSSASGAYTVDARLLRLDESAVISADRLRAAPEAYPASLTALYTDVPPGTLGAAAQGLLEQVRRDAASSDPYDLATEIVRVMGDPSVYTYDTNVSDLDCGTISQVECFARFKRGYCLHYASTMAMLLRAADPEHPIPTRLVEGFLPGTRVDDVETVPAHAAHAWVEVYFPGFGWIPFDPTAPTVGRPIPITN
jgi:transglutaminase-like putative cysteine protease